MTLVYAFMSTIGYLWAFWLLYVLVMGFYRASLAGRLEKWSASWCLAIPALIVGILVDIVANWTVAAIWFWEWPKVKLVWPPARPDLVTTRLTRYLAPGYPEGRNKKHAKIICNQLLDPFDPTGSHCSDTPVVLN